MTPAKKAAPSSLSDLLKDKKDEDVARDENVVGEEATSVGTVNETGNVNTGDSVYADEPSGPEVVEKEKPVDLQAENPVVKDDADVANPDGVSFSGNQNVVNKTPADMAAETPQETANRYGISDEIPDSVANDPNVQVYADDKNYQIPGGTHLHPDVARDRYNRNLDINLGGAVSTRTVVEHVFAGPAERDDKGLAESRLEAPLQDNYYAEPAVNDDKFDEDVK